MADDDIKAYWGSNSEGVADFYGGCVGIRLSVVAIEFYLSDSFLLGRYEPLFSGFFILDQQFD